MALFKYVGKNPLSFIHNGIPSYLSEGMTVKARLVDYVLKKYPNLVEEITENPVNIPIPQPEPQKSEIVETPVVETTLVDVLNILEAPDREETLDILFSVHSSDSVEASTEVSQETATKFDVSVLTTYERVLELYKNELIDLCKQLGLETSGRKSALVDRICLKLGITIK